MSTSTERGLERGLPGALRRRPRTAVSLRQAGGALLLACLTAAPMASHADTVASLLGDFTINQFCGIQLTDDAVNVHFTIVFGQLPALRELHQADTNSDGVTTQEERDAYVSTLAPGIADKLKLTVDGAPLPLHTVRWTSTLPKEQSGFSLRMDIDYASSLSATPTSVARSLTFDNGNFPGRIGWHEIVVKAPDGLKVFDTNAFDTSLTGGLTNALSALPATGPLDERAVHMKLTRGVVPVGAPLLTSRLGTDGAPRADAVPSASAAAEGGMLQMQTRRLIGLISTPQVPIHVAAFALLAAFLLGALHAFSPGHGKSVVGAYLVGSRGTPRHAVFLGFTVTITHTLIVFAVGLATLFASEFIVPERLFPILSLLSGLLVFGMGLVLLTQRWGAARVFWRSRLPGKALHVESQAGGVAFAMAGAGHHGHGADHSHEHPPHSHDHSHDHMHPHGHADEHAHVHELEHAKGQHSHWHGGAAQGTLLHSHGGTTHSHLPPAADGGAISWRGLLALGISGGLLPCPSAMVLLLAAVALNKTLFGLLLVVAFSLGLAMTLIAVGLAFLYARDRFKGRLGSARWPQLLPVLSAASITVLGAVLCIGALLANPV